jgi:hypothetical protein
MDPLESLVQIGAGAQPRRRLRARPHLAGAIIDHYEASGVLLVRSPIPNEAERTILRYVRHGITVALLGQATDGLRRRFTRAGTTTGRRLKEWRRPSAANPGG